MSEPVCECGRCWRKNHPDSWELWPTTPPPRTWTDGTIRVAVPCLIRVAYHLLPPGIEVESECEFWGHDLEDVRRRARRHILVGPDACTTASEHTPVLILPDGAKEPLYPVEEA